MSRIEIIEPEDADGELAAIYDDIAGSRGRIAAVHKIASLNPASIRDHMSLYRTVMFAKSPLTRAEREMIAVVVSARNRCAYCIAHHGQALDHFWKDSERVERLPTERSSQPELTDRERLLCRLAETLTAEPADETAVDIQAEMRRSGLGDRAILDATLVIAYFNFVNRIVLGLGVELETDPGGYNYE